MVSRWSADRSVGKSTRWFALLACILTGLLLAAGSVSLPVATAQAAVAKSYSSLGAARFISSSNVSSATSTDVSSSISTVESSSNSSGVTASTTTTCPETTLTQPFLQWEDARYYSLIPGGSFEAGEAPWTLSNGAIAAAGSEAFAVTGTLGELSLDLPEGATAKSPLVCVEPTDRTFRFFDRAEGPSATITVKVVYENSTATSRDNVSISKTLALSSSSWAPSPIFETGVPASSLISGGNAHVSISFTATRGAARIDDAYIDPRMR